jgi:hypothetical protein
LDTLVEPAPIGRQILDHVHHPVREDVGAFGEDLGELGAEETQTLADRNAALKQESTDLVDDAGTLADQTLAHAVQRLQVQLVGRFGGDELHGRALDCFGDCFSVAEIVLLPFAIWFDVLRWHEPCVVAKRMQPAAEVMGSDAGLHADQARRQVRESSSNLAARPSLAHDDGTTLIQADDVKRILADIDAHGGN